MAAPSMAAALAATLPTPATAPAPAAPIYEAIPASMSTAIDIEAEIPLTCVQLDALVVTKIVQHGREALSASAHGLLLGLDLDGVLEVSNSFPLPSHTSEEDDKSSKSIARYQALMLRSLKEVQGDDNVVGFYQATTLGAFLNQTLVDTQAIHQERLRHGGIVIVHDVSQATRGHASFRAFRLTSPFMDAYKKGNFSAPSLTTHRLTFSSVLEEIPVRIRTNPLTSGFLQALAAPGTTVSIPGETGSLSVMDLGHSGVSRSLEQVAEAIDNFRTEDGNVGYLTRQIAREKVRAEAYVAKRREENAQRVAEGLSPLPEEDVSRLFKIPSEPSRLESMLLLGQVDAHGKSLETLAGLALVKMFGARVSRDFHI